jgi:sarcosine oxidase subunit beta
VTPDANPIIGAVGDLEGFVMAAGFSGHGFMHSPATGQLVAELITDGHTTTLDITPFSAARFASGEISVERNVI